MPQARRAGQGREKAAAGGRAAALAILVSRIIPVFSFSRGQQGQQQRLSRTDRMPLRRRASRRAFCREVDTARPPYYDVLLVSEIGELVHAGNDNEPSICGVGTSTNGSVSAEFIIVFVFGSPQLNRGPTVRYRSRARVLKPGSVA